MSCFFQHCCGGGTANNHHPYKYAEKFKQGAFVSPEVYESTRIKASAIKYMHKPIPWVRNAKFQENYELGERLGVGSFGVVYDAIRRTNYKNKSTNKNREQQQQQQQRQQQTQQQVFAAKIIPRQAHRVHRQQLQALVNEVQILADLRHPNIVRLLELYKDPTYFFLVLEKLNGGELFDKMCQRQCYNEKDARDVCRTLFDAMAYCHKHHVAHRDMKPENLLLQNYDTNNTSTSTNIHYHYLIKVCDFGFAKFVERPNSLVTLCGTAAYMAPEILNYQPYDQRVDNWSVGVILFMLLGGYAPFDEHGREMNNNGQNGQPPNNNNNNNNIINNRYRLNQQIRQGHYIMYPENWDGVSPDAKALIKGLLTVDMKKRLTMEQALEHPWMTGHSDDFLQTKSLSNNLQQFKRFQAERKEKQKQGGGTSSEVKSVSYYWLLSRS